jgi:hypothetical protein
MEKEKKKEDKELKELQEFRAMINSWKPKKCEHCGCTGGIHRSDCLFILRLP